MTDDALPDDAEQWVLVDFDSPAELADAVSDALWSLGVVAVEEIETTPGRVVLRTSLGAGISETTVAVVNRFEDVTATPVSFPVSVADTWREFVTPTHVVDDVWLVPQWCPSPVGRCVRIEPFDTFGLGNHPTTVLTLRGALGVARQTDMVLDLGSGSGVLSVAVAQIVGCRVEAHDIAAQGEKALAHNALLNGCDALVSWLPQVGPGCNGRYDLVMANILAPVLRQLAADIQTLAKTGASIVLSGLREDQVDGVVECYGECDVVNVDVLDGWAGVTLRRR